MELILIRHGESIGNVAASRAQESGADVIQTPVRDADVPLSDVGRDQADALGAYLAELPENQRPQFVWCSPYLRARETASLAMQSAGWSLPLRVDERLRDRELGILDMLTATGVDARFPQESARRRWLGKFYYRPPGGEAWTDVVLRLRSLLADLDSAHSGDRVMVVCHDAVILLIRYILQNLTEAQLLEIAASSVIVNASVSRFVRNPEDRSWEMESFNRAAHLREADVPVTQHSGDTNVHPR